ncbi:hypothetical protein Tco_0683767 [Tanacetum coccineum]
MDLQNYCKSGTSSLSAGTQLTSTNTQCLPCISAQETHRKMVKKKNVVAVYGLVQWTNGNVEDATWELLEKLSKDYSEFDLNS